MGGQLVGVVPYIGTWIETDYQILAQNGEKVVPYIGTWIETCLEGWGNAFVMSYLI